MEDAKSKLRTRTLEEGAQEEARGILGEIGDDVGAVLFDFATYDARGRVPAARKKKRFPERVEEALVAMDEDQSMVMEIIFTGVTGRSPAPVGVVLIFVTMSMPSVTFPNTGCLDCPPLK